MKDPIPTTSKRINVVENTLFHVELLKDQKRKENEEKKPTSLSIKGVQKKTKLPCKEGQTNSIVTFFLRLFLSAIWQWRRKRRRKELRVYTQIS